MSTPPKAKRRKLNNHSYANVTNVSTINNIEIDFDGVLSLAEALIMERQTIISLLKYHKNIDLSKLLEWILKIQTEQTSIVTALTSCFGNSLNSIASLKQINQTLNTERNSLLNLLNGDIVTNMEKNNNTIHSLINDNKCYQLMAQRIGIIQNLMHKNKDNKNNNCNESKNENENENEDSENEIEIMHANKPIKCPLTQCIVTYPKRSIKCHHTFECFAIVDYILNKQTNIYYFAEIKCPVCSHKISLNDLITDYKMINLLQNQNNHDKTAADENNMGTNNIKSKTSHVADLTELSDEENENDTQNTNNTNSKEDASKQNQKPAPLKDIVHSNADFSLP